MPNRVERTELDQVQLLKREYQQRLGTSRRRTQSGILDAYSRKGKTTRQNKLLLGAKGRRLAHMSSGTHHENKPVSKTHLSVSSTWMFQVWESTYNTLREAAKKWASRGPHEPAREGEHGDKS